MGFRTGSFATIWEVEPKSSTMTKGRISISRKNKETGQYDTDFSGYVTFVGSAAAQNSLSLKEKDRIKLGDVDVSNTYDKDKKVTYTNFKIFSFELQDGGSSGNASTTSHTGFADEPSFRPVDDGEVEDRLPF